MVPFHSLLLATCSSHYTYIYVYEHEQVMVQQLDTQLLLEFTRYLSRVRMHYAVKCDPDMNISQNMQNSEHVTMLHLQRKC